MLQRIEQLINSRQTFAFETTLTTRSYVSLIKRCVEMGYTINLVFLWLASPELAVERVRTRVMKGGHNIPENVIKRRYEKGLQNFINLFMSLSNKWIVADNSQSLPLIVAQGTNGKVEMIYNEEVWKKIMNYGN
jgi:predicted ABC-type ATPase